MPETYAYGHAFTRVAPGESVYYVDGKLVDQRRYVDHLLTELRRAQLDVDDYQRKLESATRLRDSIHAEIMSTSSEAEALLVAEY